MAKEKVTEEVVAPTENKSEQKARWEAFLAKHKEQNPEKHALREVAGELKMPVDF